MEKEMSQFLQPPRDFTPSFRKKKDFRLSPYGVLARVVKRYRNRGKDELVLRKLKSSLEGKGISRWSLFGSGRKWEKARITIHYTRERRRKYLMWFLSFSREGKKKRRMADRSRILKRGEVS